MSPEQREEEPRFEALWDHLAGLGEERPGFAAATTEGIEALEAAIWRLMEGLGDDDRLIGLPLANDWRGAVSMLTLLRGGRSVAVLSPETPTGALVREAEARGCSAVVSVGDASCALDCVKRDGTTATGGETAIQLSTSGTTGAAKHVLRPLTSWRREASRYVKALGLCAADHVLIAAPIAHAYALGALWGAMLARARIELAAPSALTQIGEGLVERATIVIVTPTIARLLAKRARYKAGPARLRLVMAGAGPVNSVLDDAFGERFGQRLGRNFGSTETGAIACGAPPLPSLCVGRPMPGIEVEILDDEGQASSKSVGTLAVRMEGGERHVFGDQVRIEQGGTITILGRRKQGIRRGERWLSPLEIEEALLCAPNVKDAHVRGVSLPNATEDRVVARIVPKSGDILGLAESLRTYCADRLPPEKRPEVIEPVRQVRRGPTGKPLRQDQYVLAEPERLAEISRAYKASALLFALLDARALEVLALGADADTLALSCGLRPAAANAVLEIAALCGIVTRSERSDEAAASQVRPVFDGRFIELERHLFDRLSSPTAIHDALRQGLLQRAYEKEGAEDPTLQLSYAAAMDGPHRAYHRRLALRKLRPSAGATILEIGASGGAYAAALIEKAGQNGSAVLQTIGRLSPPLKAEAEALIQSGRLLVAALPKASDLNGSIPGGPFEIIVIDNGVHGPYPGGDLEILVDRLAPNGTLLIDDIFLSEGSDGGIGVDWLTHGGVENLTLEACYCSLEELGLSVSQIDGPISDSLRRLILAKRRR